MATKAQRQQAIARAISGGLITSQPQIVSALKKEGIRATQATISRDLEELGAMKVRTVEGETAYAIPDFEPNRVAPMDQLRRVLGEWVAEVHVSPPIVVVRTPPGCAHVVASALDRSRLQGLVGTVAGDDTVLCVADIDGGAMALASRLTSLAGLGRAGAKGFHRGP